MFTLNEKTYRNLQEQVLKNKEDIAYHYSIDRVLADFGIRVIGRVDTPEEIESQPIPAGGYQYGDAYAVGALNSVYDYYIYTRPFEGETENQWFNIGALQIEGPVGPQGVSITNALVNEEYQLVLTYSDGRVVTIPRSLRGADGATPSITLTSNSEGVTIKVYDGAGQLQQSAIVRNGVDGQSIQGEPGPAGPIVQLQGIITSMSQLDGIDPTTLPPNYAYLLEQNGNRYIIGIVADQWTNLGIFSGGTLVTKDGVIQNEWNADTKVDKITNDMSNISSSYEYIYVSNKKRNLAPRRMDDRVMSTVAEAAYQIVCRDRNGSGNVRVPETPTADDHAASKSYVDNKYHLYRHNINFIVDDSGDSYNCYFTLYNTQTTAMNNGDLTTDAYIAVNGVVDKADGRQYPIIYGTLNPGISYVTLNYYDPEEKQMVSVTLDAANFTVYDTVSRVF